MKGLKSVPARRLLSGLACLAVSLSFLPAGVRAEKNGEALKVAVSQNTTTDVTAGNTTTTTTTITEAPGYRQTEEYTVVTEQDGTLIEERGFIEGSQTQREEKTGDVPELSVEFDGLEPGQSVTDTADLVEPTISGDIQAGADDPQYDQTTVSETPREMTGTLTATEVTLGDIDPSEEDLAADKFFGNVGLTVGGKVADHANNADADDTNDAYQVDLTFALEVTVTDSDDLIVKVLDGSGTVLRTVRLAGDDSKTGYGTIRPDENGSYTIGGLTLVEGEAAFNITLEGARHLEQGVYFYTFETREDETSQTFVGMAKGYQTVDLSMEVQFSFQVDEGTVTTERVWRNEWHSKQPDSTDEITEAATEAATENTAETTGSTSHGSDNPKTGDEQRVTLWLLMMALCAMALAVLVFEQRRKA